MMTMPEREPTVIRASSAPTLLDCPRRWAGANLGDEIEAATGLRPRATPISVGAPIGTGVHAVGAELLRSKRDQGSPCAFDLARDAGMEALDKALADGEILWDGTAGNRNDAQHQVTRMGLAYSEQIVPIVEPLMVEEELRASFAPGFTVVGHMDDLVLLGGEHRIRDTKTGNTPKGLVAQLGCYSLLAQSHGRTVQGLDVDYIKRVPLKKAQPAVRSLALDQEAAEGEAWQALQIAVASVTKFRRTGDMQAFPANPLSNLCSATFCRLWGTPLCRAHFPGEPEGEE
jgi:hypothetical protein